MTDLSEYELQRLRTIESNESKLAEILGDAAQRCRKEKVALTAEQLEQRQLAKERRHRELLANQRGSSRIQEKRAREAEQALAQPVPSIYESEKALEAVERDLPKQKRSRAKRQKEDAGEVLTADQLASLADAQGWLGAMREYFSTKLSDSNLRNVMKVTTQLASGAGTRCHTKHDGVFCAGRPITMSTDFVALRREANECAPEEGERIEL